VHVIEARDKELEQRSIAELAEGGDPAGLHAGPRARRDLDTVFSALLLNSDEAAVARMLRHPASLVSLSDAGAHLTFFNDAGFGLHLLGHWVRERGELTLADAVWRLTGPAGEAVRHPRARRAPAGLPGRPAAVRPRDGEPRPEAARVRPAGRQPALTTAPVGVHGVWVNGVRIVGPAGPLEVAKLPGRLLREFVN
jgi:hypothetical protein